jgi:hypothetical protein
MTTTAADFYARHIVEQTPFERRWLRAEAKRARQADPRFWRKLKRLSDRELDRLQLTLLERACRQLRQRRDFATDPRAQHRVATLEYELRTLERMIEAQDDAEAARIRNRPRLKRPRITRGRTPLPTLPIEVLGLPQVPPVKVELPAGPRAPAASPPPPPAEPTPPPAASNVVPIRPDVSNYFPKSFGTGAQRHYIPLSD